MSHTRSIEGEFTVAVRASLKGKPIFPKPISRSETTLSITSLIWACSQISSASNYSFKRDKWLNVCSLQCLLSSEGS